MKKKKKTTQNIDMQYRHNRIDLRAVLNYEKKIVQSYENNLCKSWFL